MLCYIRRIYGFRFPSGKTLILVPLLIYCGCSSQVHTTKDFDPESLNFWKPYLLYLQSTPCQSLYVEIDTVQGCKPSEKCFESLREFLLLYCDKPAGVQIVQDKPILPEDANALNAELLALRQMDGPELPKYDGCAAYLYVLFYDSALLTGEKSHQPEYPHVKMLPYPAAIYMDKQFFKKHHASKYEAKLLLHEVGHVFGLTRNQTHGDGMHCQDKSCIMYDSYRVSLLRTLMFRKQQQQDLCMLCQSDLETAKTSKTDSRLRFIGPVLVRSENGYHVLSLPSFVMVHFGSLESINWEKVLETARSTAPEQAKLGNIGFGMSSGGVSNKVELNSLRVAVSNAENDPYYSVRVGVKEMKEKLIGQILGGQQKQ